LLRDWVDGLPERAACLRKEAFHQQVGPGEGGRRVETDFRHAETAEGAPLRLLRAQPFFF